MSGNIQQEGNFLKGPVFTGALSAMGLLGLYFGILTMANSLGHAVEQFLILWPWFSPLVLGFGIQVGLYFYIRRLLRIHQLSKTASPRGITATGGISTTAMAACCVHHLSDVLPVIGFTGVAIFFNDYQKVFLLLGVLSNIVGITVMLYVMQKHGLLERSHRLFKKISGWNMGKVFIWNAALSAALFMVVATIEIYKQHF